MLPILVPLVVSLLVEIVAIANQTSSRKPDSNTYFGTSRTGMDQNRFEGGTNYPGHNSSIGGRFLSLQDSAMKMLELEQCAKDEMLQMIKLSQT